MQTTIAGEKLDNILSVLIAACLEGGKAILTARHQGRVNGHIKYGKELVTEADILSNAAILKVFGDKFPLIDPDIYFHLEESGVTGEVSAKRAGADPLDGTNHFATGGNCYSVQAFYEENGVPLASVVFQPEVFVPLSVASECIGRLAYAKKGGGAWSERTIIGPESFKRFDPTKVEKPTLGNLSAYPACVPISTKMDEAELSKVVAVLKSGLVSVSGGFFGAGANVMACLFGGMLVYFNIGAGEDLDIIPPQLIAEEAGLTGLTVWNMQRRSPVWNVKKQPVIFAPSVEIAGKFLDAAGFN